MYAHAKHGVVKQRVLQGLLVYLRYNVYAATVASVFWTSQMKHSTLQAELPPPDTRLCLKPGIEPLGKAGRIPATRLNHILYVYISGENTYPHTPFILDCLLMQNEKQLIWIQINI